MKIAIKREQRQAMLSYAERAQFGAKLNTTKLLFMAALALMTAACSSNNDELTQQPAKAKGITITAQLAPKGGFANTRAVEEGTDGDNKDIIKSSWAVDEHLAILYTKDGNQMADARIKSVDGSGNATIEFTVEEGTADNTECSIIYPLSAAKGNKTGVKDDVTLLTNQSGTLSANLDVRVGAGTIQTSTPSLTVTTQPEAKFAIWKLTVDHESESLYITADGVLIADATLSSAGTEFTVAVPAVSSKNVAVVATDESSDCWCYSKAGVSLASGKYYQSSLTLSQLDNDYYSKDVFKLNDTGYCIIGGNKTVVLSELDNTRGIEFYDDVTIILLGTNSITATDNRPAIQAGGSDRTLTITGTGSLTATGHTGAAGIGGNTRGHCGNIVICGGSITANGTGGAGIGGGEEGYCGNIFICGGTIIADSSPYASAGIGSGAGGYCGNITITDGVTSVKATKGATGASCIGPGHSANCGTVTFGSAQVFNGSAWSPNPMVAGNYGGLSLAISGNTWTLTPTP